MNSMTFHPTTGRRFGEAALWSTAGLLVLALHLGAGFYLMSDAEVAAGENAPPPAIMIELAPEPEAAMPEETQITEQTETSEEIKSETAEPVEPQTEPPPPEPTPEPVEPPEEITPPEPAPPEPVVEEPPPEPEPVPEPQEQEQLAALENVEVPLPVLRPPPPVEEKKPEEPKKKVAQKPRPPKKQAPAAKASEEAKIDANQSNRTAAKQTTTSSSASSSMTPQRWQGRLAAHLERRKRYPSEARSRREEGTVYVRFQIDNGGNVLSVSLSRSSGSSALDQEVLALVKRASPVPAPPTGVNKTITFPMQFTIR